MSLKFPISLVGNRDSIPKSISLMPVYYADLDDGTGTTQVGPSNLNPSASVTANPTGGPDGAGSSVLDVNGFFNRGGYANVIDMAGVTAYSASIWFKIDDILNPITNLGQRILYWGKINEQNIEMFAGAGSSSDLRYSPRKTDADINAGTISNDTWYHVLLTWDYTEYKMYLNGQLIDTKPTNTKSLWLANGAFTIGDGYPTSDTRFDFTGEVAMLGMWRQVLTADDALYLYNGGLGRRYANISL